MQKSPLPWKSLTVMVILAVWVPLQIRAQEPSVPLKYGRDYRLALDANTSATWQAVPLQQGLQSLSESHQVAIFLDRRIDPDQRIDFVCHDESLQQFVIQLAAEIGCGVCLEANVIYFGPPETTDTIPVLLQFQRRRIDGFSQAEKRVLLAAKTLEWPLLAQPQQIVRQCISQYSIKQSQLDKIPHDLWNAGRLPANVLHEQLTLLLAGFDLTFSIDGLDSIHVIETPFDRAIPFEYSVQGNQLQLLKTLSANMPQASFDFQSGHVNVTASLSEHAVIYQQLNPLVVKKSRKPEGARDVFTLNVTAAAGSVLATIAKHLDLQLEYDADVKRRLAENVKISATQAPIDEVLRQALDSLDLTYRIEDGKLKIELK
jgi:hypothetical protein